MIDLASHQFCLQYAEVNGNEASMIPRSFHHEDAFPLFERLLEGSVGFTILRLKYVA
jgi:hypothetical protein